MWKKKVKDNSLCKKSDAKITEEECRKLLDGSLYWMRNHPAPLVRELYAKMHYQLLRPRVLVSYVREPYIYKAGNVRVTFDSHIRTTLYHRTFLEDRVTDIHASGGHTGHYPDGNSAAAGIFQVSGLQAVRVKAAAIFRQPGR